MNHRGETRELAAIAQPTIAVITNAQREHQEFMRSVDEVAAEHADAITSLRTPGTAVVNADDARRSMAPRRRGVRRIVTFGLDQPADVSALRCASPRRRARARDARRARAHLLHAPGRHMASNALAAAAVAHAAHCRSRRSSTASRPSGRFAGACHRDDVGRCHVIDDSYNANPDSVRAAVDVLAARPRPRWLVLGDMGEVGEAGAAFHAEIGTYARESGVERMLAVGVLSRDAVHAFGAGAEHFESVDTLAQRVASDARAGVTVLVKGSRFMRMERVVAALTGQDRGGAH
jgi:UDP-N-acetylmuramoyl-tripeptide--D-alanyl-D-alanine ligase